MYWLYSDVDGQPILCDVCKRLLNSPDYRNTIYFILQGISDEQYHQIVEIWEVDPYDDGFAVCMDCIQGYLGMDLRSGANQWLYYHWQEHKGKLEQLDNTPS